MKVVYWFTVFLGVAMIGMGVYGLWSAYSTGTIFGRPSGWLGVICGVGLIICGWLVTRDLIVWRRNTQGKMNCS